MELSRRIELIRTNVLYQDYYEQIKKWEKNRIFCHHDMAHFLDVARLAMIIKLKEAIENVSEEFIYAAALLHDIGRFKQYEDGTPHQIASAKLAPAILQEAGFDEKETAVIISAILNHRNQDIAQDKTLDGIIYRADKMSRSCFACDAETLCDWKKDKKNLYIKY